MNTNRFVVAVAILGALALAAPVVFGYLIRDRLDQEMAKLADRQIDLGTDNFKSRIRMDGYDQGLFSSDMKVDFTMIFPPPEQPCKPSEPLPALWLSMPTTVHISHGPLIVGPDWRPRLAWGGFQAEWDVISKVVGSKENQNAVVQIISRNPALKRAIGNFQKALEGREYRRSDGLFELLRIAQDLEWLSRQAVSTNRPGLNCEDQSIENAELPALNHRPDATDTNRAWLGVQYQALDDDVVDQDGTNDVLGARIVGVLPGSPALDAGISLGDVILRIDDVAIGKPNGLGEMIAAKRAGSRVSLTIARDGRTRDVEVDLGEMPDPNELERMVLPEPQALEGQDVAALLRSVSYDPILINGYAGLDGVVQGSIVLAPFAGDEIEPPLPLRWAGATGSLTASEGRNYSYELQLGELQYDLPRNQDGPALRISFTGGTMNVEETETEGRRYLTTSSLTIDRIVLGHAENSNSESETIEIPLFEYRDESELPLDLASWDEGMRTRDFLHIPRIEFRIGEQTHQLSLLIDHETDGVDPRAIATNWFGLLRAQEDKRNDISAEMMHDTILDSLRNDPVVHLRQFRVLMDNHRIELNGRLQALGLRDDPTKMEPKEILRHLRLEGSASATEATVVEIVKLVQVAEMREKLEKEGKDADADAELLDSMALFAANMQIAAVVGQGFVSKDGDALSTSISFDGRRLEVNGKEIPLDEMAEAEGTSPTPSAPN